MHFLVKILLLLTEFCCMMAKSKMNADNFIKIPVNEEEQDRLRLIPEPVITLAVQKTIKPVQASFQ